MLCGTTRTFQVLLSGPQSVNFNGDLPAGWRHWSPAEKMEHLLGMTLDQAHYILSWPAAELDPYWLKSADSVWQGVFMIGARARS
jgi:hypothetical protein